jgi:GNAT superfamily N-acetyltransferase
MDARRQVVTLTGAGRAAFTVLNSRTVDQIGTLLEHFNDDEQRRLLSAMGTIASLVGERATNPALVLRPPRAGDLGWVVYRHGVLYAQEYGWDESFEALVARVVADYSDGRDAARQAGWIAEVDGERVGSIFCVPSSDESVAKLRLLFVERIARGLGVGKRLVFECLEFARARGYTAIELWTVSVLAAARAIYQRAGFELVTEEPLRAFGHDLVSQTWRLEL